MSIPGSGSDECDSSLPGTGFFANRRGVSRK